MVCRQDLFEILLRLGCPVTLLTVVIAFHDNMRASVSSVAPPQSTSLLMVVSNKGVNLRQRYSIFISQRYFPAPFLPLALLLHSR